MIVIIICIIIISIIMMIIIIIITIIIIRSHFGSRLKDALPPGAQPSNLLLQHPCMGERAAEDSFRAVQPGLVSDLVRFLLGVPGEQLPEVLDFIREVDSQLFIRVVVELLELLDPYRGVIVLRIFTRPFVELRWSRSAHGIFHSTSVLLAYSWRKIKVKHASVGSQKARSLQITSSKWSTASGRTR